MKTKIFGILSVLALALVLVLAGGCGGGGGVDVGGDDERGPVLVLQPLAYPAVPSVTETAFGTAALTHDVQMPATVDANDLLIVLFVVAHSGSGDPATVTTPGGWNLRGQAVASGTTNDVRLAVYYKKAAGTEDGTTVNFATSSSARAAAQVYRISASSWHGTTPPEISTAATYTGTDNDNPNPGSLSPSWGATDTLWIAAAGFADDPGTDDGTPANYTDGYDTLSGGSDPACQLNSARRVLNAASENPGEFDLAGNARWVAYTIAVRPTPVYYTITASAGPGGTIAPSGAVIVEGGNSQTFNITPNSGYIVSDVVVDSVSQGRLNSYTFPAVSANHTIVASLEDGGWEDPSSWTGSGVGSPGNAQSSNDAYAEFNGSSDYQDYYNFGFSIPDDATINGIKVAVEGHEDSSETRTWDISLSYNGGTSWTTGAGTGVKNTGGLQTYDTTLVLGGSSDNWNYGSWTPAIINSDNFRVRIDATSGSGNSIWLDQLQVKVYYTACTTYYEDSDGDGFGNSTSYQCLAGPSGAFNTTTPGDCDDSVPTCTTDCTTDVDSDLIPDCADTCIDADGDGYGSAGGAGNTCTGPDCDESSTSCNVDCVTDVDADGTPDCKDTCIDPDGDGYGVGPGCTGTDCDETSTSCNVDCVTDVDTDGTPDCKDTCIDPDGDGYGVGPGCTGTDCDETSTSCNVDCVTDVDTDGTPDCKDTCIDPDGDGYGVGPGCTGTDCDETSTSCNVDCVTDVDTDGTPDCKDTCIDPDGDGYGTGPGCTGPDCDETSTSCNTDCVTDVDTDGTPDCKDTCIDPDGDGYGTGPGCTGTDCDETSTSCNTDCVTDVDTDGTPDCKDTCIDPDGDGYGTGPGCTGPDCDETSTSCNTDCVTDVDTDGTPDCKDTCVDPDGDGYGVGTGCTGTDCDETSTSCNVDCVTDVDSDGIPDCKDPSICADADGDGYGVGPGCTGPDCDETSTTCNTDCVTDVDTDGTPDCKDTCIDPDGDGYGSGPGCTGTDCDETSNTCNVDCATDADSDGTPDCKDTCIDPDGDGYGVGTGCTGTDCDETSTSCNTDCSTDADSDGTPDCKDTCIDLDGDGYGSAGGAGNTCTGPDCDDNNINVHPGATEVCNGIDDDCDGSTDEGCTYNISGTIQVGGIPLPGVSVTGQSNPWTGTAITDALGHFTLAGIPWGETNIHITPTLAAYIFSPPTITVTGPMTTSLWNKDFNGIVRYNTPAYGLIIYSTEGGSVITPGEGLFPYLPGIKVSLVASPHDGYKFVNWTGDVDTVEDVDAASTSITMEDWHSISANFETDEIPQVEPPVNPPVYPTVTTKAASTNSTILHMSYTLGDLSTVQVRFAYKKSDDSAWSYTDWVLKSESGTYSEPLTGLASMTKYNFKGQLKYNATVIDGKILGFTTPVKHGCFIATAAYGTPTAEQIDVLREFRDAVLLESTAGSQFVALYYQLSPPVAEFIAGNELVRTLVREIVVDPIVWIVEATRDMWRN